ncbi:MAG TPA: O-antigen ligase family protein [Armatimonadota bacterium]|jgi:O-antigen ligase
MAKRKSSASAGPPAAPPPALSWWLLSARLLLIVLVPILPLAAGKLAVWQTELVALVVLVAALLAVLGAPCKVFGRPHAEDWAAGALLVLLLAAIPGAAYLHAALVAVMQVLSYLLALWLARGLFADRRWRDALVVALIAGGALVALLGGQEYLLTVRATGNTGWRVFATFFNPNLVAAYLLVMLPPAAVWALQAWRPTAEQSPLARPLSLGAVLVMLVALPLTGSKGAALGALVAVLVLGWTVAPRGTSWGRRLRWGVLALILCGLLAGAALPPLRARVLASTGDQANSSGFRLYVWKSMVTMIHERPLRGFGPGSFEWTYPHYAQAGFTRLGHESYLQMAAEAGLPALLAFLALWIALLRRLGRRVTAAASPGDRLLPAAALAALAGFLVHNLVDYSWYCPAVTVSLLLLVGAALAGDGPPPAAAPRPRARWLVAAALLVITLLVAGVLLPAQYLQAQAHAAAVQGNPSALELARRACALDPQDADLLDTLAKIAPYQGLSAAEGRREAIAARLQAARLRPGDATNLRLLALLYADASDLPHALAATQQCLTTYPTYLLGWATQARLAAQAGNPQLATASWQHLADLWGTPIQKYAALGDLPDPNYLFAWDYLAARARERGDRATETTYRRLMAVLLEKWYRTDDTQRTLMHQSVLLREGDEPLLDRMADETEAFLAGEPADAPLVPSLQQARTTARENRRTLP